MLRPQWGESLKQIYCNACGRPSNIWWSEDFTRQIDGGNGSIEGRTPDTGDNFTLCPDCQLPREPTPCLKS